MNIPVRSLTVLIDLKKEAIANTRPADLVEAVTKLDPPSPLMRRAKIVNANFQRGCRNRASWTPVH